MIAVAAGTLAVVGIAWIACIVWAGWHNADER